MKCHKRWLFISSGFFLTYQYISTLQGKVCKTDSVPDHCFISQRIMLVYAFSISIGDFQRKLSTITYCGDTRNTRECKFIPNSRVFFPEDGSLGLDRQFSCGFAEDCRIWSGFPKSPGFVKWRFAIPSAIPTCKTSIWALCFIKYMIFVHKKSEENYILFNVS